MLRTVNVITIECDDLDASCAFYGPMFDREPAMRVPTTAFFDLGAVVLSLFTELEAETSRPGPVDRPVGGAAIASNLASPADVDRAVELAERSGGTIVSPPVEQEWGGYSGYVADPDGHLLEIAHNPHWPLAEDGTVVPNWRDDA